MSWNSADWKNLAGSIASFAPTIGAAVGGPAGSIAGMGVKALANVFGIDTKDADADLQISTALESMTPEQAMQVKNADLQFKKDMAQLGVDVFKLEVADKASARKMFVETGNLTPMILTFLFVVLAGYITYEVFNSALDGIDKTLVGTVVGYIFGELKAATSFWMGSSMGSKTKTDAMTKSFSRGK